jgi:hypothetical protein
MEGVVLKIEFNVQVREFRIAQYATVTVVLILGLLAYIFADSTGHGNLLGFLRLLNVGSEQSIPTYVSVLNLLIASILLFIIYNYERAKEQSGAGYWMFLSILFLYLSLDESASIHENFANIHDYLVDKDVVAPVLDTHQWLPFGLFFLAVVSIILVPFIRKLQPSTRRSFIFAGGVFVTGAIGFEYLGALMLETGFSDDRRDMSYLIRRIFEGGFEMDGIVIFNCALYHEIVRRKISLTIQGDNKAGVTVVSRGQ